MRIVHSFSTKYCTEKQFKVHVYYFTLSAVYAKKSGFDIVLHTDEKGFDVLKYAPYDEIFIDLEYNNIHRKEIFAWTKFKAMENEPNDSIHIDGDVFLKKDTLKECLDYGDYDIIVQHLETRKYNGSFWDTSSDAYSMCKYPPFMPRYCTNMYNCGIIGFKNKQFYKEYSDYYFQLINEYNILGVPNKGVPDLIAEQQLLYCFAKHKKLKVKTLLEEDNITKMANEIGYQHLQTSHKYTDFEKCKRVLNKHRPDLYQILEKYFGDN